MQRSRGHSAVGGAAYRAGQNIKAQGAGKNGEDKWFRYSPKRIVVREDFIMKPQDSEAWVGVRAKLWNHVEQQENRVNSRLGRDVNIGLAYELNHDEQRALVREFAQREFVDKGFVVDVAIHNYGRTIPAIGAPEDQAQKLRDYAKAGVPFLSREEAEGRSDVHFMEMRNRDGAVTGYKLYQPHAHLRVTPRVWKDGAFQDDKQASRQFNTHQKAMEWRYEWPRLQNAYLERAGAEIRVTSTSNEEDQFPDIRLLGLREKSETHAVEQRADALDSTAQEAHAQAVDREQSDRAFREVHNETLKDAFTELEDAGGSMTEAGERTRAAIWWHRTSERFNEWRFDFREKAAEWKDRFEHHTHRIRQVIGWHKPPEEIPDSGNAEPGYDGSAPPPNGREPER